MILIFIKKDSFLFTACFRNLFLYGTSLERHFFFFSGAYLSVACTSEIILVKVSYISLTSLFPKNLGRLAFRLSHN